MLLISTALLPAFNDDPHGVFADGTATARADGLARILDGFYTELAAHTETRCGHAGRALSLADNVVMVVSGDTPNLSRNASWAGDAPMPYIRLAAPPGRRAA